MTHRERVMAALSHEEPDRVPMDLGGSVASTITSDGYPALRAALGLPVHPKHMAQLYSSLPEIEEDVRVALDVDIIHAPRAFGTGDTVQVISENALIDEWGVRWCKPEVGPFYVETPLFSTDATARDVREYNWPKAEKLVNTKGLRDAINKIRSETDYAISLELRGRMMSMGQFLCGFENWFINMAANESFVHELLEHTTQLQIQSNHIVLHEVGDLVDIVYTTDDLGSQRGPLISPKSFQCLLKPYFRKLWEHIRGTTSAKFMHHSCGSILEFIPAFIEMGAQALNPIQVSADNMDPVKLKAEFGKDLCFWGGVDTRDVMPNGTTADVRDEVARRIKQMANGGGYILAAVHDIAVEVPPTNIIALFNAGRELGTYPLKYINSDII